MSGDNFSDEVPEVRPVLGDLTNRSVKRGFSLITDHLGIKSANGSGENTVNEDGDSRFAKQVCLRVENLVKEKCKSKFGAGSGDQNVLSHLKDEQARDLSPTDSNNNSSQENTVSVVSHRPNEVMETTKCLDGSVEFVKRGKMMQSAIDAEKTSKDSCASSGSIPTSSGPCKRDSDDEEKVTSNTAQSNPGGQEFVSHVCTSHQTDLGGGRLASGECGSVECSMLPKPQGSRSFELDRCTALKGECPTNLNAGADLLKTCSCSFCLKAAYIWSDLHYQDIKGRISALKKSQKEASILVNKYGRGKQTDTRDQGNTNSSLKLESDLTVQWRSLFHHMENVIGHENNQLQANFVALRNLREDCKMDLERANGLPSE